ncbi:hypothetical protein GPJ56_005332 [Histomonas meleagridis]|uniref:uncharacterized protein n=1 Tax=Histomonas meleagridis TaxID=135588 RepID=UPI0035594F81|nr:hypothetical protein GPJ56_005332 [Histomonas meleagridis]KAH0796312.1 hypothetical protein GO595_010205 [Histomonas meleagridis]
MSIVTNLNYAIEGTTQPGCTKWIIATDITLEKSSNSFHAAPSISQATCSPDFMAQMNLTYLPQRYEIRHYSFDLLIVSIISITVIIADLSNGWKHHTIWTATDSTYNDLDVYDQIHFSLGFWHPLQFVMNIVLIILSVFLMIESFTLTQYLSSRTINLFSIGFFLVMIIICRWFVYMRNVYQIVLIIRVSFVRLVSIFIGFLPLVCALMMFGIYLFGLVSMPNVTFSYYRFFQMFIGNVFGDDNFGFYQYFTDGSNLFDVLSLIYCSLIGIVSGYAVFPAFTASVARLRETEALTVGKNVEVDDDEEISFD